jgi:hypothetical protein
MSIPIQFGDIVAAISVCLWIRGNCFDPIRNAQVQYAEFKRDVLLLERRLNQIKAVIPRAAIQIEDDEGLIEDLCEDRSDTLLQQEANELVGDFNSTLQQCKQLLQLHVKYDARRGTWLDNAFWNLQTQQKVDDLRAKIQSHTYNIWLFIEPLQLRLITDIKADVSEILRLLKQAFKIRDSSALRPIPTCIEPRFLAAIFRDSPVEISNLSQIPLKEAFQALIFHIRNSTAKSPGIEAPQSVEEYINLLKAHWLMNLLNASTSLRALRQGHLYRRIIQQIEVRIMKEYARDDLLEWTERDLNSLNDSAFAIWHEKTAVRPPPLTTARYGEEELETFQLIPQNYYEKQEVVIFRVNDECLRIVRTNIPPIDKDGQREIERAVTEFNVHEDRLIPRYAMPSARSLRTWCIQTISRGGSSSIYDVSTKENALAFQRAITRYDVAGSSENVLCAVTFKRSSTTNGLMSTLASPLMSVFGRDPQSVGRAELQLWEPLSSNGSSMEVSRAATDYQSDEGRSMQSVASRTFRQLDPAVISIVETNKGEVVLAKKPAKAYLFIFSEEKAGNTATCSIWKLKGKALVPT